MRFSFKRELIGFFHLISPPHPFLIAEGFTPFDKLRTPLLSPGEKGNAQPLARSGRGVGRCPELVEGGEGHICVKGLIAQIQQI